MDSIELQATFDTDEYIFREGDAGDCAYIIDSGMVEVSLDKDGRKLVMATLTKGDILGEMAIINREPRTASARAIVPTEVTAIPLDYVSQKIEQSDPTVRMFLRLAMARYRDMNARLAQVFESLSLGQGEGTPDQIGEALRVTGHFLRTVLAPSLGDKALPEARQRLADLLSRQPT